MICHHGCSLVLVLAERALQTQQLRMGAGDNGISAALELPQPAMRSAANHPSCQPRFDAAEPERRSQQIAASQCAPSEPMGPVIMPCQPPLSEEWRNNSIPAAPHSDMRAVSSAEALAQHAANHAESAESQLTAAMVPDDVLDVWLQVRQG